LEELSALALHPSQPDVVALGYNHGGRGWLFSSDGGESVRLLCSSATGASLGWDSPLSLTAAGEVLAGSFHGMWQGDATGCGFAAVDSVHLQDRQVAAFAFHPERPELTYLVTASASSEERTGLLVRRESGALEPLGANDAGTEVRAGFLATRLHVVSDDAGGTTFLESGLLETGPATGDYRAVIRRSDDQGESWTSRAVPDAQFDRALLLVVDPQDNDRWVVAIDRARGPDPLLLSEDAGQSFSTYGELFEVGGAAVDAQGRLWVGDAGGASEITQPGALLVAPRVGGPLRSVAARSVHCLGYQPSRDRLLVCERSRLSALDPETATLSSLVELSEVAELVQCDGQDLAVACQRQLCENWCGVTHRPDSPVCTAYDPLASACGAAASSEPFERSDAPLDAAGDEVQVADPAATGSGVRDAPRLSERADPVETRPVASMDTCSAAPPGGVRAGLGSWLGLVVWLIVGCRRRALAVRLPRES
jgi:hypothetical protein